MARVLCFKGIFNREIAVVPDPQGNEHPYRVVHGEFLDWYELGRDGMGGMLLTHAPHRANEEPAHTVHLSQ